MRTAPQSAKSDNRTLVTAAGSRSRAAISATESGPQAQPEGLQVVGLQGAVGAAPVATTMDIRSSCTLAAGPAVGYRVRADQPAGVAVQPDVIARCGHPVAPVARRFMPHSPGALAAAGLPGRRGQERPDALDQL